MEWLWAHRTVIFPAISVFVLVASIRRYSVSGLCAPAMLRAVALLAALGFPLAAAGAVVAGERELQFLAATLGGMLAGVALLWAAVPSFWRPRTATAPRAEEATPSQ